jgi:retron-type reverse transcriptase
VLYPEAARAEDREQLRSGTYQPQPVRRVEIRKPDGQGMRKLGIPSGLDRFVQPAVLQVLQNLGMHKCSRHRDV